MRSRISVLCLVVSVLFVSATLMGGDVWAFQKDKPGKGGKPSTIDVLQLVFNDMTAVGARVVSDGAVMGGGGVTYTDRRIPDDGETCVTARFTNRGGTFSHFNRGSSSTESPLLNNCNAEVSDPDSPYYQPNHVARTYILEFPYEPGTENGCACDVLNLDDPDGDGSCSLVVDTEDHGAPRIATSSLFKNRDRTATIDLMFRHDLDPLDGIEPESFVISSNSPLIIGAREADDHRYLQSLGEEFRLNSLTNGDQCGAFPFWLSIDFIKFTVPRGGS